MSTHGGNKGDKAKEPERAPLVGEIDKNLRYKTVEPFTGERNKLQGFVLQLRLYIKFNGERFRSQTEQVLWAVTLLEGKAMNWVEGFLEDYLTHTNKEGIFFNNMQKETLVLFQTWEGFLNGLRANFGVMDERAEAERAIESLRQKGSATAYTRDFQRYSTRTGWGDASLRYQYKRGLKDSVKDELLRYGGDTDTLASLIEAACKIDNDWYERSMERKGKFDPNYRRTAEGRRGFQQNPYDRGDPMQLDATFRELSPNEKQTHLQNKTCFSCGRAGHMARNCKITDSRHPRSEGGSLRRGGGRQRNQGGNFQRRGELNATITGRGGYNGPMQLNATLRTSKEESEEVAEDADGESDPSNPRASDEESSGSDLSDRHICDWEPSELEAESLPRDVRESHEGDSDYQYLEELTLEESIQVEIGSGTKTARTIVTELLEQYNWKIEEEPRKPEEIHELSRKRALASEFLINLYYVERGVEVQLEEASRFPAHSICRSQQYQDKIADNIEFQSELRSLVEATRTERLQYGTAIQKLEQENNVARTDHPRHAELAWSACYTDTCLVHYQSKIDTGNFPQARRPVYWTEDRERRLYRPWRQPIATTTNGESSKN
jgi:Retrotransposon gag protein/Zinc knuckle